jgi:hypothetical protein
VSCYSVKEYARRECSPRILYCFYLRARTADILILVLNFLLRHHDVFLSFFISDGTLIACSSCSIRHELLLSVFWTRKDVSCSHDVQFGLDQLCVEADFTACEDFYCIGIIKVFTMICVFLFVLCYQSLFVYFDMTFM